jgi:hypothetical protein
MQVRVLFAWVLFSGMAAAQAAPAGSTAPSAPPVSYSSVSELNQLLADLQRTTQDAQSDLASLRVERWKTDSNTKRGTSEDIESIQRNLKDALPEITGRLRSSPESLPTTFELYRNLDALYDVFTSVVESAGAFGSRDEYQTLQNDLNGMQKSRRAFAERMEKLSKAKEDEVTNLRTQLQKAQAVQETTPPKKVVVDDTDEPKPPPKKKPTTKKPKPSPPAQPAPETSPPQNPPNPPTNPQS